MIKNEFIQFVECSLSQLSCSLNVRHYIACQFALESDFGNSAIAKDNNNLCGMRPPVVRPTLCIDTNRAHAVYFSRSASITDYVLWLAYNKFTQRELNDLELFKLHLEKANYNSSENYIAAIDRIYQKMFNK